MREEPHRHALPEIVVADSDYERLSSLAAAAMGRMPEVAGELLAELDRATIVAAESFPPNVVRIGSTVTFLTDGHAARRVTLVLPGEADISNGRISVLTPIGAALIGLSEGQEIAWSARDGKSHRLTIQSIDAP